MVFLLVKTRVKCFLERCNVICWTRAFKRISPRVLILSFCIPTETLLAAHETAEELEDTPSSSCASGACYHPPQLPGRQADGRRAGPWATRSRRRLVRTWLASSSLRGQP